MNLNSALRTRASAITMQMNRNNHFTVLNMGVRPAKFKPNLGSLSCSSKNVCGPRPTVCMCPPSVVCEHTELT